MPPIEVADLAQLLWDRHARSREKTGKGPNWIWSFGATIRGSDPVPPIANETDSVAADSFGKKLLASAADYFEDHEFNSLIAFRNTAKISMPSVGYAGKMVVFNQPTSDRLEADYFEDGKVARLKFKESFGISGNSTLDMPEHEEIVGVIAYSVRTESLAPALKELGF